MKDKNTNTLLSFYREIQSKKAYDGDLQEQIEIASELLYLLRKEALLEDIIRAALFYGAERAKISPYRDAGSSGLEETRNTINVALEFEVQGRSVWMDRASLFFSTGDEDSFDESALCGMEDELFDLANEWMDNVTGLDSIMDVPFEIYKNNPDATMTEAKKHMFTPDQRRMMEAHERNDAVCASARDKRPSQRF